MNYIDLSKDIKNRKLNTVYLFTGPEEFIMDGYIKRMVKEFVGDGLEDLNFIELGPNNSFDDLFNACETLPFMSEKKLVLVKDLSEFLRENKGDELTDYLDSLSPDTVLILKDKEGLRKNTKLYKKLKKLDGIVEFTRLNRKDLEKWILNNLNSNKKTISSYDLNYLVEKTGYLDYKSEKTLFELKNELRKIIDHSNNELITREDVDSNFIDDLETNIFKLLDSINGRNTGTALDILRDIEKSKEPMYRVFFMIMRNMRLMLKYKVFASVGYNDMDIQKKMKISPYEFKNIKRSANSYTEEELRKIVGHILELDLKQKTSSYDEKLALEILIVKITNRNI